MSKTLINLDRQVEGRIFSLGTTAAGGDALLTINKGTAAASTVVLDVKGSANIAGDLNLIGNLNLTGAINSQTVTNTNVVDVNITLNSGGTTAGAAGAGFLLEGDAGSIIGKLLFDNTLTSKWKIGSGSSQSEIVTVDGAQTLTNKIIGGSQITGNISGNAANVTGIVAVANGGTGASTFTAGYLKASGTSAFTTVSTISGADISGNITGNAANVTGVVAIANGGTGQTTKAAAYNALTPITTLGDIVYGSGTNTATRLAGNTTSTKKFLVQTGTGSVSAAPLWDVLVSSDIPNLGANPSATIGLTANNGSATTYMRSDATPALSQAIIPTWTGIHTFQQTNITTTSTDALVVSNNTAATGAVTQQNSPRIRFVGSAWKSNATAAAQTVEWWVENRAITGAAAASANLVFTSKLNGGAATDQLTLKSDGSVVATGSVTASSIIKSGGTASQFLKADGSVDTNVYITGNQSITISGDISGTGTTAITASIGANKVTNSMLAQAPANTLKGNNSGVTANVIDLTVSQVKAMLSLNNVENTALSSWAGSSNITTLGTISSGTWNATVIDVAYGGTGVASFTPYAVVAGGSTATGDLQQVSGVGTAGQVLTSNGAGALPTWQNTIAVSVFKATTVSGTQDGANKTFTIGNAVVANSELVTVNGQVLTPGASNDYVLSGTTLTFQAAFFAPVSTDVIRVYGAY